MTREEFIQNSVALIGTSVGWQSEIARRLNISDRHVRRIVKGQANVTDGLAKDLIRLLGESAPQIIHAEWVLGDGSDGREYLIHTYHPRFQCLVVSSQSDYDILKDDGIQYTSLDYTLAGFIWLDHVPDNATEILERACDFIESVS